MIVPRSFFSVDSLLSNKRAAPLIADFYTLAHCSVRKKTAEKHDVFMSSIRERFGIEKEGLACDKKRPIVCPITLEDVQLAVVLDGRHVFDAHAVLKHFIQQALVRGMSSVEWTNPMTNAPVKSAWKPPASAQAWVARARSALPDRADECGPPLSPSLHFPFGKRGYLCPAVNPSNRVQASASSGELGNCGRIVASWDVDTQFLFGVWSCVSDACASPLAVDSREVARDRVWGALGRYALARNMVAGSPLHYDGPDPRDTCEKSGRGCGRLLMADGTQYAGDFLGGCLHGRGTIQGPSSGVTWLRSSCFRMGSVNGTFRMRFVNGHAGSEGMVLRAVSAHAPPGEGRPRRMGAFRVYSPENTHDDFEMGEDWSLSSEYDAKQRVLDRWWSERASFEVRFEPLCASHGRPCIPVPARTDRPPVSGVLTVRETVYDSALMSPRRFLWSGPVHFRACAGVMHRNTVDFSDARGGGPATLIVPSFAPVGGFPMGRHGPGLLEDRLDVVPPYAPENPARPTADMLRQRVRELLLMSERVTRMFFTACDATLWTSARVALDD